MAAASRCERWGDRVVDCVGLENQCSRKITVGSNPAPTALIGMGCQVLTGSNPVLSALIVIVKFFVFEIK